MKKFQRIGAIAVIALLLSLYVICFIAAISGGSYAQTIFRVTLGLTIALPILLYIFILMLRMAKKKAQETPETLSPGDENPPHNLPEE